MNELIWIAGVVALGAVSPGPNNLIVMESGMQRGILRTLPAIGGVIVGTLVQIAVVIAGFEFIAVNENMSFWLALLGSAYLAWLGVNLLRQAIADSAKHSIAATASFPGGFLPMSLLQFVNPKTWALVTLAVTALQGLEFRTLALGVIFSVVPAACLLFWALMGKSASAFLAHATNRRWFHALMGSALIGLAFGLIP